VGAKVFVGISVGVGVKKGVGVYELLVCVVQLIYLHVFLFFCVCMWALSVHLDVLCCVFSMYVRAVLVACVVVLGGICLVNRSTTLSS
jgi:hypothetical protein